MKKQNLFERIDEYFKERKQSEVVMTGIGIGAIIAFLAYMYLFPIAENYLSSSSLRNADISSKLTSEKNYIQGVTTRGDIPKLKRELATIRSDLRNAKNTNAYINKRLTELSYLLFNDKNWAEFLDSITGIAKEHSVKVLNLKSQINEPTINKIEQILKVEVKIKGKFHGIMKFINALEESMLIVDINGIELLGKKQIDGDLNISVWGMKY